MEQRYEGNRMTNKDGTARWREQNDQYRLKSEMKRKEWPIKMEQRDEVNRMTNIDWKARWREKNDQ